MIVAERIKMLRQDQDKTQKEIADILGTTRSAYSNYENEVSQIPLDILSALADYYHVSVDYLLGRTNNPAPPQQ